MKEKAAEQLRLTSDNMHKFGLVDGIIPEPIGGAHWDYNEAGELLKAHLLPVIEELKRIPPEVRTRQRIEKFNQMGSWEEVPVEIPQPEVEVPAAE
jgi:acetyl-CoA carboxylase carboxyl transferase subunit alpha